MSIARTLLATFVVMVGLFLTSAKPAHADIVFNEKIPFVFYIYDQCTDEVVVVEGEYHALVNESFRKGTYEYDFKVNAHGTGIGLISGNEYVFNDTYRNLYTSSSSSFLYKDTYHTRLISKGSLDNQLLRQLYLFGFDENGNFFFDFQLEIDCRG